MDITLWWLELLNLVNLKRFHYNVGSPLFFMVLIISCNKNNQNSTQINLNKNIENENITLENVEKFVPPDLPKIMYVNSKEGLRIRSEPSINGEVTGLLIYGERIIIHEKSENSQTIDGITDYWYKLRNC